MASVTEALSIALNLHQGGRTAEAEGVYRQIIDAAPSFANAHYLLGVLCGQTGRLEESCRHLRAAVGLEPLRPDFAVNLASALFQSGDTAAAAAAFRNAAALAPGQGAAYAGLGAAREKDGRIAAAADAFRKAGRIAPADAGLARSEGAASHRLGRLAAAFDAYDRGLAAAPGDPALLHGKARALWEAGRLREAQETARPLFDAAAAADDDVTADFARRLAAYGIDRYDGTEASAPQHALAIRAEADDGGAFLRTLVVCFCDPEKPSLNWQLHALHASYRALGSADIDFLVTIPPGTAHLIDPAIPHRFAPAVEQRFAVPAACVAVLEIAGVSTANGYAYMNHFLAALDLPEGYDYVLLADVDTVLLPSLLRIHPKRFLVGAGEYSIEDSRRRLAAFAAKHGYQRYGRYHNLSPTWYGERALVSRCAEKAMEVAAQLLAEDWEGSGYGGRWWFGVLTMYTAEVVLNEFIDDLSKIPGMLDAHPTNDPPEPYEIHLHMWRDIDPALEFSKQRFDAVGGPYETQATGKHAIMMDFALQGREAQRRATLPNKARRFMPS